MSIFTEIETTLEEARYASGPCRDDTDKKHMQNFHRVEAHFLTGEQLKELCCTYMRDDFTVDWSAMREKAIAIIKDSSSIVSR